MTEYALNFVSRVRNVLLVTSGSNKEGAILLDENMSFLDDELPFFWGMFCFQQIYILSGEISGLSHTVWNI